MKKNLLFVCAAFILNLGNCPAQSISAGDYYSLFLCGDSSVMGCGVNTQGVFGTGNTTSSSSPVSCAVSLTGVIKVVAGVNHSLFLKSDGTVWACGNNMFGQLGTGDTINRLSIVQVAGLSGVVDIAAGNAFSLFVKNDGTAWSCGRNTNGALGDSTTNNRSLPYQIPSLSGIIAVGSGQAHSLFVKNDGTVWACGTNSNGQLGDSTTTSRLFPVRITSLSGIIAVGKSPWAQHSLFLKNDSTVWAAGYNLYGQLGDGSTTSRSYPVQTVGLTGVKAVAPGWTWSLFVMGDGTVKACGYNTYGELGDGTTTVRHSPVQVIGLTGVIAASGGDAHSIFLKNDGTVRSCGYNNGGQLGIGTTDPNPHTTTAQVTNLCQALPCITPTVQVRNITFSNITSTSVTLSWMSGSGNRRIAKLKLTNNFTAPVNGNDYVANPAYSGSGEQVVYNGTGNSVTVTGLSPNSFYWFRVYEASCTGSNSLYYISTATGNPRRLLTQNYFNPNRPEAESEPEETQSHSILLYPTPTTGLVTLESSEENPIKGVTVYSADGRVMKRIFNLQLSTFNLDLQGLSAGIYFLDCLTATGREKVKVVKY